MEEVGILYICTGKYYIFWKEFYKSAEKYLLPGCKKQYFVFTDAKEIYGEDNGNVSKIYQEKLQFPLDSLMRFDMFLGIKPRLQQFDYLYFFNANIIFVKTITGEELFPSNEENGLIGYQHSGFYNKKPIDFIYERNPISAAYIADGEGHYYYQGSLIGGQTNSFLHMAEILNAAIKEDLKKDFIAVWWDESHLNRYLVNKKVKLLHPGYTYPELLNIPFEKKAVMLDKTGRGGLDILRGIRKPNMIDKIKFLLKRLFVSPKL